MADLNYQEKKYLEKLFEMEGGYVLDFSNHTFQEYIFDSTKIDIDQQRFYKNGDSKARRLRACWELETNYNVGLLIDKLLNYWRIQVNMGERTAAEGQEALFKECHKVSTRLTSDTTVQEIDAISEHRNDRDFSLLAKSIRESIDKNEPEVALDRLHTYLMKYIRKLCDNHKFEHNKDDSLNAVYGKYIRFLVSSGKLESKMS